MDHSIIERVKFLQASMNASIRKFAQLLDLSESNVRNYTERGIRPSAELLTKVALAFPQVNLKWLLTGEGEPFQPDAVASPELKKTKTGASHDACCRERDSYKAQLDLMQQQVVLLNGQLKTKDELLAAKEEILSLLRTDQSNQSLRH